MKTLRVNLRHLLRGRPRPRHAATGQQKSGFHFKGWFVSFARFDKDLDEARRLVAVDPAWPL